MEYDEPIHHSIVGTEVNVGCDESGVSRRRVTFWVLGSLKWRTVCTVGG